MTKDGSPYLLARTDHIRVVDALRGLAALAVVLFHFGAAILPSITPNVLTEVVRPGKYGLFAFFVISGFIIPYAMYRSGYTWSSFGNFLARRWVRLGPPAYAAACFMILYHLIGIWVNGVPVEGNEFPGFSADAILSNLTFTVGIVERAAGEPEAYWYNFVYWSLAIEFQFYILLALLFPLLMDQRRKWLSPVVMAALLIISQWPSLSFFRYTVYFLLGILVFQWHVKLLGKLQLVVSVVVCCVLGIAGGHVTATLVAAGTALIILAAPANIPGPLLWLGTISYSLYILHPPVGYFLDSIGKRVTDIHLYQAGKVLLLFLYTAIAVMLSAVFHRLVERPFLKWSKSVGASMRKIAPSIPAAKVLP